MHPQIKDRFYDQFLKEPTKDRFIDFVRSNCGEMNEIDFKEKWVERGHLAKTILAMANSGGGIIVFGVKEEADGSLIPVGLEELKDKSKVDLGKLVSPNLDYEILDFNYDSPVYSTTDCHFFQIIVVHYTPDRLPFVSLGETNGIDKDIIYVRRNTRTEKANEREIQSIIQSRLSSIYNSGDSDLSLPEHLRQLRLLYEEMPRNIRVVVRRGEPSKFARALSLLSSASSTLYGEVEYEEQPNPVYPQESYEQFVSRMIEAKKLRIERVLDVK